MYFMSNDYEAEHASLTALTCRPTVVSTLSLCTAKRRLNLNSQLVNFSVNASEEGGLLCEHGVS